jgi:hypothetical protein
MFLKYSRNPLFYEMIVWNISSIIYYAVSLTIHHDIFVKNSCLNVRNIFEVKSRVVPSGFWKKPKAVFQLIFNVYEMDATGKGNSTSATKSNVKTSDF